MKNVIGMFVALMLALSMLGVGVAHWSDSIQIEGTVNMGSLTVGWADENCGENLEPCSKPVASISCWLEDNEKDEHTGKTISKTLVFVVENAYPEYVCWVEASIKNAGTIPVDLKGVVPENMPPENVMNLWYENADNPGQMIDCPTQIDPCENIRLKGWIHIKENAPECHTYKFKLTLQFDQWGCD